MNVTIANWKHDDSPWLGEFNGVEFQSDISVIFNHMNAPGAGAGLHRHPYSETFIVRRGSVRFTAGPESFMAHAGQIVVVGPNVPHAFIGCGKAPIEMIDIHASSQFQTEWL